MSERPSDSGGLTSGDPLNPGGGEPPRHESGLPGYEAPARERPADATFESGYTTTPPPGAFGGAGVMAPAGTGALQLAGWWSRVAATLIDGLIIGVGGLLLMALFGGVFSVGFFASDEAGVAGLIIGLFIAFLAFAVISLLYAPWMMARTNGRTLGRMAMNIRVVRADAQPITFGFAMLREVAVKWLLFGVVGSSVTFGIAYLVDLLWPLWDDENRALHDFIVNTRVVKD